MSADNDDGEVNRVTTCEKKNAFYTIIYESYVSHIFKKQQKIIQICFVNKTDRE